MLNYNEQVATYKESNNVLEKEKEKLMTIKVYLSQESVVDPLEVLAKVVSNLSIRKVEIDQQIASLTYLVQEKKTLIS